tara:strand:+ start:127 stop:408 length:282 start_codon:yes stop_codon:yes gene_type:complete
LTDLSELTTFIIFPLPHAQLYIRFGGGRYWGDLSLSTEGLNDVGASLRQQYAECSIQKTQIPISTFSASIMQRSPQNDGNIINLAFYRATKID